MRKQTVLIPLDGSVFSRQIISATCRLLPAALYQLLLLRVAELPAAIAGTPQPLTPVWSLMEYASEQRAEYARQPVYEDQAEQNMRDDLERALVVEQHALEAAGYTVTTAVRFGDPAQEIAEAITSMDIDMIAMATHGRTGVSKLIMGSVAEHVLRNLTRPLLLVRPHGEITSQASVAALRTIVVPLDGSAFAEQALIQAQRIAAETGATLVLVAAVPLIDEVGLAAAGAFSGGMPEQNLAEQERLRQYLKHTVARLAAEGLKASARLVIGHPADAILQISAEEPADLIVMATHGRSGLLRVLLGSVAARVVHGAALPVLLVRPQVPMPSTPMEHSVDAHMSSVSV